MRIRNLVVFLFVGLLIFSCKKNNSSKDNEQAPNNTYVADEQTIFQNPERGWFYTIDPDFFTNKIAPPLTVAKLSKLKIDFNVTLVRKYYMLYPYRNTPLLPASFITDQLLNDFAVCRAAGFKLIPRFIYNWNQNFEAGANRDASTDVTLAHINQLMPVLNDNVDVIDHLQAGFIGQYGEWHDSYNGHITDNSTLQLTNSGMQIANALFDKFSKKRMIALRYAHTFRQLYSSTPVTEATAYNGSNLARSGFANDGFAYDERDFGAWPVPLGASPDYFRPFMRLQTQYTVASGEPAGGDKDYTKKHFTPDLELFHYSSLSMNQYDAESGGLYAYLKSTGEYDNASRRFGYRYRLVNAFVPDNATSGENINVRLTIENDGWAALYNERKVQLVFKNKTSGAEFSKDLKTDPRFWLSRITQNIKEEVSLSGIPAGLYAVYLRLPDIAPALQSNPAYSIRFANKDLWDAAKGFNSLQHEITVK